ncbi:MAG: hypothetical protein ACFFAV_09315, partial [Candidatus Hermodarchaeota archaeon]
MPIVLGILFHGNFPFSMHYTIAYNSCYKHLPIILREFPEIPVNWHLSATLLQQLAWKNPETLKIFSEGLNNNQFELLGSSYAQNILYICSEWVNREQIKWNRSIIYKLFPDLKFLHGYWNPERVFYEDLVNLLVDYGYNYTLVESDILESALATNNKTADYLWKHKIKDKEKNFYFFPDNQKLKENVDTVIQTGQVDEFIKFLDNKMESDSDRLIMCYAEDAEVSGFWQIAKGLDYKKAHNNLRLLLNELMENDWIEVKLLSEMIKKEKSFELGTIPAGQATWMIESVKVDGYKDWFDYVEKAPEVQYYKKYYEQRENQLKLLPNNKKKRNLMKELLSFYLSQQFEFGCSPGSFGTLDTRYLMNVPGMQLWDDRITFDIIYDWLMFDKKNMNTPNWKFRGSMPTIEWSTSKWICQFNPFGGRCTFLVNKDKDSIFSPNPYFSSQDRNVLFNNMPYLKVHINYLDIEEKLNYHGNLLMDNCYVNSKPIGSLETYKVELKQKSKEYIEKKSLKHTYFNSLILPNKNSILFWYSESGILLTKEIREYESNLRIDYKIRNLSKD